MPFGKPPREALKQYSPPILVHKAYTPKALKPTFCQGPTQHFNNSFRKCSEAESLSQTSLGPRVLGFEAQNPLSSTTSVCQDFWANRFRLDIFDIHSPFMLALGGGFLVSSWGC